MNSKDPYADHRDNKGRFKKGNIGGPGRPQQWVDGNKAARKWKILIEKPPRCACGGRAYRFKIEGSVVFARCNHCDEKLVYDGQVGKWWKDIMT